MVVIREVSYCTVAFMGHGHQSMIVVVRTMDGETVTADRRVAIMALVAVPFVTYHQNIVRLYPSI